ncbi:MAG TPA: amidohydrolase family protein, partial [Aeromicrobium sp.]|nr:amidohydrolase family protein [Aeromicrobium sp.]
WIFPGSSVHEELQNFSSAGIDNRAALRAATSTAAAFLGEAGQWGVIEPGARADLLLVDDDPLEDLSSLSRPVMVIAGGAVHDRGALDALLHARREAMADDRPPGEWDTEEPPPCDCIRSGSMSIVLGGADSGRFDYRHTAIEGGMVRVDERLEVAIRRRETSVVVDADLGLVSAEVHQTNLFGQETWSIARTENGYRADIREVDGHVTVTQAPGPLVPSDAIIETMAPLLAADPTERGLTGASVRLGELSQVEGHLAVEEADGVTRITVEWKHADQPSSVCSTVATDGCLIEIEQLTQAGTRVLRPLDRESEDAE